jgi:SAM-dependent methyltransferase
MTTELTELKEEIRSRYAEAARRADAGAECAGPSCCEENGCCGDAGPGAFGANLYDLKAQGELPGTAVLASLGCGNPTAVAELREGEVVLDLGSGGGIDVLLSAKRVGPAGLAYGVDMTDEMLDLARRNAAEAGVTNAHFLKGEIENVPLPDSSVDVVISNCVVNLSTDKPAVLREIFRVLRPGGRVGITDVVAEDRLSPDERAERGSYVGCIAGALSQGEYERGLHDAGFEDVSVRFTHRVADGMHSAIVQAAKRPLREANRGKGSGETGRFPQTTTKG